MSNPGTSKFALAYPGEVEKNGGMVVSNEEISSRPCCKKTCRYGCSHWCRKYFWEGQVVNSDQEQALQELKELEEKGERVSWGKRMLIKHRRFIGPIIPACVVHFFWWAMMIKFNWFYLFKDKWYMTLVMIIGSIIAGMTCEGGGAVAFPVLTLGFSVDPSVARDVAMMVQATGMSCASFAILFMRVKVCWESVILCEIGGVAGFIMTYATMACAFKTGLLIGFYQVDPYLTGAQKKIGFVSVWAAFASVLLLTNRNHKRKTYDHIPDFKLWKGLVLVCFGFVGGLCTSFAGSGLDVCSFSCLTLLFRVSEKVATPTSVLLMASCSFIGLLWRGFIERDISTLAWEFCAVTMEITVMGAPTGAFFGSHFHRLVLASAVIIIDIIALIGAYVIIPLTPALIGASVGIIVGGFGLFGFLSYLGHRLMMIVESDREKRKARLTQKGEINDWFEGNKDVSVSSIRPSCVSSTNLSHVSQSGLSFISTC